jgi:hypothetical protein
MVVRYGTRSLSLAPDRRTVVLAGSTPPRIAGSCVDLLNIFNHLVRVPAT